MAEEQALVQLMDTLDGLELTKSEYPQAEDDRYGGDPGYGRPAPADCGP